MNLTDDEVRELRAVLAAFKADLPPHDLGFWLAEIEPHRVTVEDEREFVMGGIQVGFGFARAEARCVRCGCRFRSQDRAWVRAEDDHADAVEKAKESVRREAARDGPCWGDVPKPPREEAYAVMDRVEVREP